MNANNWVVKSNALIESKGKFTALERKIFLGLVSEVRIDDEDFQDYELDISELKRHIGTKSKDLYDDVEAACKALTSRNITIKEKFEENGKIKTRVKSMSYLAYAEYVVGGNAIKVQIAPALKPYLLDLKAEFTQYQLKNVLAMKSTHSIKIYELIKQYQNTDHKKRTIEMKELKEYLGVSDKYSAFKDFEKYVLKVAEKEITELTDVVMTYKKIKKGRNIHAIEFQLTIKEHEKTDKEIYYDEVGPGNADQIKAKVGITQTLSNDQVMEFYDIAYEMTDGLIHIDQFQYMTLNYYYTLSKNPTNFVAYYKKALENDYADARKSMAKQSGLI